MNHTKKRGRPVVNIQWPDNMFTIQDLEASLKLSRVTLYQKVHGAVAAGILKESGKESTQNGRPRLLFKKVVTATANSLPSPAAQTA